MAGTQQLPSWMTLSTVVVTNAAGQPVATHTTTLELPLTYYGPSVPLGTNGVWTWGGLTPPASFTSTSSAATPNAITTPSTFTSSPAFTPTSTSTASTASSTSYPYSSSSTLSKGAIIGTIFGAIVGFNLLILTIICFARYRGGRRNQHHQTPIWTHWEVVSQSAPPPDEERPAGVGSPRDSGEEVDSFLRRSRNALSGSGRTNSSIRPVASLPPGAAAPQIVGSTGSGDSGHTGSSAVTDYGVLLPGGGPIGQAYRDEPHFPARPSSEMTGFIMPPGELLKIDDGEEPLSPPRMYGIQRPSDTTLPEVFSPLLPPPPLDVDRQSVRKSSSLNEKEKSVRSVSYPASDMEDSKVYTARRVKVKELGPRSPSEEESSNVYSDDGPVAGPSSWRDSFGLSSISRLRKSWFGGSSSRNTSKSSGGQVRADDPEVNQSLLSAPHVRSRVGLGRTLEGDRPMSSVSTKSAISGNTIYHDALSRLDTPVSVPSRAMTPASARTPGSGNGSAPPPLPTGAPPAYAVSDPYDSLGSRGSFPYSQGVDVLDLPVPQPASPFGASGSVSATTRGVASPPGLSGSHAQAWRDSLSVITGSSNNASVATDALDAEPPRAGERWRSMAGLLGASTSETGSDPGEQRVTFGTPQVVHQLHPVLSDRGSLHSHLSPYSRSSGSAPMSSHIPSGSNSSRPSAHSHIQTTSSGSFRSGSFSSFGRRQGGPVSPSVSAFGSTRESGQLSPLEELPLRTSEDMNRVSVLGPMPSFAHSTIAPTIRSVGATTTSDDTEVTRTTTMTASTDATSLDPKDSRVDDLSKFQLQAFDFESVRI